MAHDDEERRGEPFAAVQARIELLESRIGLLESVSHSAPNPSVEGRTYCAELTSVNLFGRPADSVEEEHLDINRFQVTFNSGFVNGYRVSSWRGRQTPEGQTLLFPNPLFPLGAIPLQTWVQNGRKIDLNVGPAAWTLYVSADGSVIHGNRISQITNADFGVVALATITYVEDATNAGCSPEFISAF
jgi:hypothetical protein